MDTPHAVAPDPGSCLAGNTGSWRTVRPMYVERLPPCNHACPAGENIQGWLSHAESGDYEAAWRRLTADNPLPAVMGRVCCHPCESACNRGQLDESVGIRSVERFLGDEAIRLGWKFAPPKQESGKRVLIAGAGPAGLSAAYHLRRLGHAASICEAGPSAGGMMRFGIPGDRLPSGVLDAEVRRIVDAGVKLELDREVSNILDTMREGGFDAAFLAVGAPIAGRAYTSAGEAPHMVDAVPMLPGGVPGPAQSAATAAVGHGRNAARNIDAWLRGTVCAPPPGSEIAEFGTLNTWYYGDAPKSLRPALDIARREPASDEADRGLDQSNALFAARRCLSCGNCFECDNCYGVCPDNAVIKLGPGKRFEFDFGSCKGCGICVSECPCGAIKMVPETI